MGDLSKVAAQWISQHVPLTVLIAIFIFCLFFEISKIKVYPLRWLWKMIAWPIRKIDEQRTQSFKAITSSMKNELENKMSQMSAASEANCTTVKGCFADLQIRFDDLDKQQKETEERLDKLAAARIKNHVLNFARQCRKGEQHSHEDFSNLFQENVEYSTLVEKYGWENDVYKHDFAYIQRVYDECSDRGDFLE